MNLIWKGKVKEVYDLGSSLEFVFTDNISVFDQIIPSKIPFKGEVLCRTAEFWFNKIEKEKICKTHFISAKKNKMNVRKATVIPIEFIMRHYNAGSYHKKHGGKYGEKFFEPVFEFTTKFEKYDRPLTKEEVLKISKLKKEDLDDIMETCFKIDNLIQKEVGKRNLIHVDGKKEFGICNGEIILIDTLGTPDEDRFWDMKEYEKGEIIELSKEYVRKYYENLKYICPKCGEKFSYWELLYTQRNNGLNDPAIPSLPENMITKTEELYKTMYERITGEKF